MTAFVVGFLLLLAMAAHSDATYCVCNSGLSDSVLQKNIDYACGAGADCSAIMQNGACFNPNTVKDHCNYAVNSYYQKKGQMQGSCDFQGTATVTQTAPSATSGCVYQSSPSGGGTTPTTGPTTGGTTTPPGATTPPGGGTTIPGGGTTVPGGGSTVSPGIGLGPTGSGFGNPDGSSASVTLLLPQSFVIVSVLLSFMWIQLH